MNNKSVSFKKNAKHEYYRLIFLLTLDYFIIGMLVLNLGKLLAIKNVANKNTTLFCYFDGLQITILKSLSPNKLFIVSSHIN